MDGEKLVKLKEQGEEVTEGLIELGELYMFFSLPNKQLKSDFRQIEKMLLQLREK